MMKLLYSTTSPYVRKVHMFLIITGLITEVKLELSNPFDDSKKVRKNNPLGKIPVLQDGNLTLYDSALICEYLDEKSMATGNESLFCRGESNYYGIQLLHTRANGIMEAAVASLLEKRRDDAERSQHWLGRWYTAIRSGIDTLDVGALAPASRPDIATLSLAAALGYLDFRFEDFNWREWNPALAVWFSAIEKEEWFTQTQPN